MYVLLLLLLTFCASPCVAGRHCRKWPKEMTTLSWANETVCLGDLENKTVVCNGYNRDATLNDLVNMPWSVKTLYIYGFNLNLSAEIFPTNNTLEKLYICKTIINNLTTDSFSALHHLQKLEIQQAAMSDEQHITLFQALANISVHQINLTLSEIGLTEDTLGNFTLNQTSVYKLNMDDNLIGLLNLSLFAGIRNLTIFEARDNRIEHIYGFEEMEELISFDVSNNSISEYSFNFCNASGPTSLFPRLNNLILSRNRIGDIRNDTMGCLTSLAELKMDYNVIKQFNVSSITNMVKLKKLNLRGNWLSDVLPVDYPKSLASIDMSRNEFSPFLPRMCNGSTKNNIKKLNLDYNPIRRMTDNYTACLTKLETLTLHKTSILELNNNSFIHFSALQTLDLSQMTRGLQRIERAAFNSSTLKYLDLSRNYIKLYSDDMKSIFKFTPEIRILNLSFNFNGEMNASGLCEILYPLENLEHLRIEHIGLQQFPLEIFNLSMGLISLNVSNNIIRDAGQFNAKVLYNTNISYISAAKNKLTFITEQIFPDDVMRSLQFLDIQDNEFSCDCDDKSFWFREQIKERAGKGFIGNSQLIGWPEHFKCHSPAVAKGTLLRDFNEKLQRCHQLPVPYLVAYIAISSTTFVLVVLFVVGFWNRWYLQYYWHNMKKRSRANSLPESDCFEESEGQPLLRVKYDGYVLCDSKGLDKHAVTKVIDLFERELNYKLHYEHRDGGLGGSAIEMTFEAMDQSKNIVVVVTENLMRDGYCRFLVEIACLSKQNGKKRWDVVFILMSDINLKSLSKSWCVWFTRYTRADWTEETEGIQRKLLEAKISEVFEDPLPQNFIRRRHVHDQNDNG
ncbi:toll-like receptor 3 [Dreissena polymorpha]|uniref:Toll-like receptor 4 n=1 Tax=Dreissena polymorpha TaxID=45954 RepID=A0A9D4NL43_DREPO|nr:toll-like receptor 3 [Dreissena polymorpha]KAH3897440.1 hypothetical protein DPMN_021628 [Dreissena polymorpha]